MKNSQKILGLIILLLVINNLYAQDPPINDGLVGYWPFNGDFTDYSTNSNNGTENGGVDFTTDRETNINSACLFNGIDGYIDLGNFFNPDLGDFTIVAWVKTIDPSQDYWFRRIFGKGFQSGGFSTYISPNGTIGYISNSVNTSNYGTTIISDGNWHQIVTIRNGNNVKIYVDGNIDMDVSNTAWGLSLVNNETFRIGTLKSGSTTAGFWNGLIDDFMIFNKALSTTEIMTLINWEPISNLCSSDWECVDNNLVYNYANSQVIIGTDELNSDYLFGVKGKIKTEEVLVTLTDWPDYVFKNDYKIKPLNQLEKYITINKHLPNIPTEEEVKEEGVSLGEMNAKLLEKIEELTLYIIEQNKKTEKLELELKTQIEQLNRKIDLLESTE